METTAAAGDHVVDISTRTEVEPPLRNIDRDSFLVQRSMSYHI